MPELLATPFSYCSDPAVPPFDDTRALFVSDGVCVLYSGGTAFLMRRDRHARLNFTAAQGPLGQALYAHYGIDWNAIYLLVEQGRAYTASAGYFRLCAVLGGAWHLLRIGAIIPEGMRDAVYRLLARNRYRWFGTADHCALLTPEQRTRLI